MTLGYTKRNETRAKALVELKKAQEKSGTTTLHSIYLLKRAKVRRYAVLTYLEYVNELY